MNTENRQRKQKLIVTGCNGFTGFEVCRSLADEFDVIGVAREGKDVSKLEKSGIKCITYKQLADYIEPTVIVIHSAGKTGNIGDWEDFRKINVDWTKELYDLADRKNAQCFIYISSVAALSYKTRSEHKPLKEDDQPRLCQGELYGHSKLKAEQKLNQAAQKGKTRLIILRPGFIYNRQRLTRHQSWLRRGFIADPNERIPLVHIDSLVDAVKKLTSNTNISGTFNVVDDTQPTRSELIKYQLNENMLKFRPWRVGSIGMLLMTHLRMVLAKTGFKKNKFPSGYLRSQWIFYRRKNIYDNTKLQKVCRWIPRKEIDN